MSPQITKVIYKPDSMSSVLFQTISITTQTFWAYSFLIISSTDEFIAIIADSGAYKKWLGGDKSVPLVEIVDCQSNLSLILSHFESKTDAFVWVFVSCK